MTEPKQIGVYGHNWRQQLIEMNEILLEIQNRMTAVEERVNLLDPNLPPLGLP